MFTQTKFRLNAVMLCCALAALAVAGCTPAPKVTVTDPADGATGVPLDKPITAVISAKIDPGAVNAATFTLRQGATLVPGTVAYDTRTRTATFTPANPLLPGTLYTAKIAREDGGEKTAAKCDKCDLPLVLIPVGIGIITAIATANRGLAEDYEWDFTTVGPNAAPSAEAGPNQQVTIPLGAATIDVTLDAGGSSDGAKSIVSYTWTGEPDPDDVMRPVVTLGPGCHTFALVVTDDQGAVSEPDMVMVCVNLPPVAEADAGLDQDLNLPPGALTVDVTLDGSGSRDSDGAIVAYAWMGDPDPEDIANPTVTVGPGVHVFTLIVTDNLGAASLADTVIITVNTPPVADAGPDRQVNLPLGASTVDVTLDGSASSDGDGAVASYSWSGTPDPEDTATPVVALGAGEYVFTLMVTDDDGAISEADELIIRVSIPPVADAGSDQGLSLALGASTVDVTLDGSASSDSDGTIAAYDWSGVPDPADAVSPVVSLGAGTHVFTLVVTDNDGAVSAADTVVISVNAPPVANAGPDQDIDIPYVELSGKAGPGMVDVTLDGGGSSDSDGTIVSYAWSGAIDPDDAVSPVVSLGAGTHVFTLVVTDDDGAVSAADEVTVHVNMAPVANAGVDQSLNLALGRPRWM